MKTFCITVNDDNYARMGGLYGTHATGQVASLSRTRQHFADRGVDATFFYGLHASKLGIDTTLTYEVDVPGSGFKMGAKPTGCWLSHRALWAACLLVQDDEFLILEEDAKFPEDWRARYEAARAALPADWDALFLGSCCTAGRPSRHVAGEVYEVRWPMCLQAYLVRRRALETMIRTQDESRCYGPVDITLTFHTWPKLRVYTVLPRIVEQFDTDIPV